MYGNKTLAFPSKNVIYLHTCKLVAFQLIRIFLSKYVIYVNRLDQKIFYLWGGGLGGEIEREISRS